MRKVIIFLFVLVLLLAACAPVDSRTPVAPSDARVTPEECVRPESDNEYDWSYTSCVNVSTQVYTLKVEVNDEIFNFTRQEASGSAILINGIGVANYRQVQNGKGILPVILMEVDPHTDIIELGAPIILKTVDLKAVSLPNGARTSFICNLDTEVLSPVKDNQVLTEDRLTYEFDDCRMVSPEFDMPTVMPAAPIEESD